MFRSLQPCELAREQLIAGRADLFRPPIYRAHGHPPLEHRISTIKALVLENTAEDQCEAVRQFLEEYDRIAKGVIHIIDGILESVIQAEHSGSAA